MMKTKRWAALLLALVMLFTAAACSQAQDPHQPDTDTGVNGSDQSGQDGTGDGQSDPDPDPVPQPVTIRITAAGDNLLHDPISNLAKQSDGTYDYTYMYQYVKKAIQGSDIAYINEEVMLCDVVANYPRFSAMGTVADALVDAGFNVINLATNHTLDRGVDGLETCLQNVHARDFDAVLGAFRTVEESTQQIIIEKKGIRFGFLSYTYGLNGLKLPEGKEWMVSLIEEEAIRTQAAALRQNCDYMIVSMHWGNEYQTKQNATQESLAALLAEVGTDLVIGTHPHVIQPAVWYDRPDGGKMYCVYSLGNFVSNQHKLPTMLGGLLDMTLEFDATTGQLLQVIDAGIVPTVMHFQNSFKVQSAYLLEDYTADLAAAHGIKKYTDPLTLDYLNQLADKVLGDQRRTWGKTDD